MAITDATSEPDHVRLLEGYIHLMDEERQGWWYWASEKAEPPGAVDDEADVWAQRAEEASDLTIVTLRDDEFSWFGTAWVQCAECGKETHRLRRERTRGMLLATLVVHDSLCRACWYDFCKDENKCPDWSDHGACKLEFHHSGRCQPHHTEEEMKALLRQLHEKRRKGTDE